MYNRLLLLLLLIQSVVPPSPKASARTQLYDWPTGPGEAVRSKHYRVWIATSDGPDEEVEVLQSDAIYEGGIYRDGYAYELKGRTFSFASFGYDPAQGMPVRIRVERTGGDPAAAVNLSPRSYGIAPTLMADGRIVTFEADRAGRYLSVDFQAPDNRTASHGWIKHMLCIFIDPIETDAPSAGEADTVELTAETGTDDLVDARTILIPQGHHNLARMSRPGFIEAEGKLILREGQHLYLAPGAFVEGHVVGDGDGQRISGRGILSGRQYAWNKQVRRSFIDMNDDAVIQGIMVMEAPLHGIVCNRNALIEHIKFLGWHWNNDGLRPNRNSVVRNSFLRCADDFFYNLDIHVHDVVLWPAHNGSIMTYGWGNYPSGGSLMEDVDIIHPEWVTLQNNNGLIMSQVRYAFKPFEKRTILRNIRIEGSIPGFINLKPRSGDDRRARALPAEQACNLGYIGHLTMENISIDHQFDRGLLRGDTHAVEGTDKAFEVRDVIMRNITIDGHPLTDTNLTTYIDFDPHTTRDIRVE